MTYQPFAQPQNFFGNEMGFALDKNHRVEQIADDISNRIINAALTAKREPRPSPIAAIYITLDNQRIFL
jgi:hypothetical protein